MTGVSNKFCNVWKEGVSVKKNWGWSPSWELSNSMKGIYHPWEATYMSGDFTRVGTGKMLWLGTWKKVKKKKKFKENLINHTHTHIQVFDEGKDKVQFWIFSQVSLKLVERKREIREKLFQRTSVETVKFIIKVSKYWVFLGTGKIWKKGKKSLLFHDKWSVQTVAMKSWEFWCNI